MEAKWQREEKRNASLQNRERIPKCAVNFLRSSLHRSRIAHTPVRRHRLPRPNRTDLVCRVVTDRKDEIHLRRLWLRKLIPALAAQTFGRMCADSSCRSASGRTFPDGWLPAL